jgi:peptide deformylase
MSVLPLVLIPDPVLRKQADPVERVDDALRKLADDMFETMYDAPGIGLAAPQIGVSRRLIVMDPARGEDDEPEPLVMVNPVIHERSEMMRAHDEGCLSIPEVTAEIERPALVRVSYLDLEGERHEATFEDIWSTLVQHEIDHLDGVLFIDYLSRLKRDMIVKKFTKSKKSEQAL